MIDFQLLLSEPSEGVLVMNLSGEVDMATAKPLQEATHTAVSSGQYSTLVFDLSNLGFMDSTGLHILSKAHREMTARGGSTRVVCTHDGLLKIFELTGLDRLFTIVNSRADAFALAG